MMYRSSGAFIVFMPDVETEFRIDKGSIKYGGNGLSIVGWIVGASGICNPP